MSGKVPWRASFFRMIANGACHFMARTGYAIIFAQMHRTHKRLIFSAQ